MIAFAVEVPVTYLRAEQEDRGPTSQLGASFSPLRFTLVIAGVVTTPRRSRHVESTHRLPFGR